MRYLVILWRRVSFYLTFVLLHKVSTCQFFCQFFFLHLLLLSQVVCSLLPLKECPRLLRHNEQVCRVVFSFQTRMFLIAALGDYRCKSCSVLSQLSAISTQKNKGASICYPTFHFNQQLQMYFALRY